MRYCVVALSLSVYVREWTSVSWLSESRVAVQNKLAVDPAPRLVSSRLGVHIAVLRLRVRSCRRHVP